MSISTLTVAGRDYVLVPRRRYEELTRLEEDRADAKIARKGRALFKSGKMKTVSHAEVKRRLGL